MLSDQDRDFQRLAAALTGSSVNELRTRIATGFLDCARKHWGEAVPHWDGRLARTVITPDEIALIEQLGKASYESVVDGLVCLWSEDIKQKTLDEGDQRAWESHVMQTHGEPDDWWP